MTRQILIIVHSEASTPGRIGHELVQRGYRLDIRRPCLGEALPETLAEHQPDPLDPKISEEMARIIESVEKN